MYSEANWMGYSECTTPEGVVRRGEKPLRDLDPVEGGTLPELSPHAKSRSASSCPGARRIRPTRTSSRPAASSGDG